MGEQYYDPAVGRFINADGYVSTGQDLTSCNMFAYCGNNSVNRTDPSGHSWVAIPSGPSWITIQSIASEIARAAASMAPAYTVSGVAVVADGPLPFGDMAGVAIAAGATAVAVGVGVYNGMKTKTEAPAVPISKARPIPPPTPSTYYHLTSKENANIIKMTGSLRGSTMEGGYVFAWEFPPNKYARKNSGAAETQVLIKFETYAAFEPDWGISNYKLTQFGPVRSVLPGPIHVFNVGIMP